MRKFGPRPPKIGEPIEMTKRQREGYRFMQQAQKRPKQWTDRFITVQAIRDVPDNYLPDDAKRAIITDILAGRSNAFVTHEGEYWYLHEHGNKIGLDPDDTSVATTDEQRERAASWAEIDATMAKIHESPPAKAASNSGPRLRAFGPRQKEMS